LNDKGTRDSATALVPTNSNAGSGLTADGTFEKGADLDGGAASLAGGYENERVKFRGATDSDHYNFEQDLIIPKNATLTIWVDSVVTVLGTVYLNYHTAEGA
jgi:hypothetical protein